MFLDFFSQLLAFIIDWVLVPVFGANLVGRRIKDGPPQIVPDDAPASQVVLLAMPELVSAIVSQTGLSQTTCEMAVVCRLWRRVIRSEHRRWETFLTFTPHGKTGGPPTEAFGLSSHFPLGLPDNQILVSNTLDGCLHLVSAINGREIRRLKGGLVDPYCTACDGNAIFVADNGSDALIKLLLKDGTQLASSAGKLLHAFDDVPLGKTFGVALEPEHEAVGTRRVFASDRSNDRICVFDSECLEPLFAFGKSGEGFGELRDPCAMTVYNRKLFVCDRHNSRVHVFSYDGEPIATIGRPRQFGPGTFLGPSGIACSRGMLIVIDSMGVRSKTVQVISAENYSPRQWLQIPGTSRLVGVGVTEEHCYVVDACGAGRGAGVDGRLLKLNLPSRCSTEDTL